MATRVKSNPEPAVPQHSELRRQRIQQLCSAFLRRPVRRGARRVRVRHVRPRRRAAVGESRPALDLLGRVDLPQRQPQQRRLSAEPARPAEVLCHARHRGQGAVPTAEEPPGFGDRAGYRHAVVRRPVPALLGKRPLSRGRHLSRPGRFRVQRAGAPVRFRGAGLRAARSAVQCAGARRLGPGLALEPDVARRHARLLLPQFLRQAAADFHHEGRTEQHVAIQPDLRRQHRTVGRQLGQEHRRHQFRRRGLVPPQHAAQQPGPSRTPGLPAEGDTKVTRGDTYHALVNALGVIPQNPLFDTASWSAELTWATWSKVTSGENLFFAEGFAACKGKDIGDGCTTKNYTGPRKPRVSRRPGSTCSRASTSASRTYSRGLSGNAPTVFGGNEGNGNYSVGYRRRCPGRNTAST